MRTPRNKYADHAVRFINNLNLTGDFWGQPMKLRGWQEAIIRRLFGTRSDKGKRVVKSCFLLLPRKCAKTYLAACICIYSLFCLGPSQVVLATAASRGQAGRIYEAVRDILIQDPFLMSLCEITKDRIAIPSLNSYFVACGSSGSTAHGHNPTICVLDELHAWRTKNHHDLFEALTTGRGARREPLTIMISTQTKNLLSIAGAEFEYARTVQGRIENGEVREDGTVEDPSYLAALYYANADDDWHDEKLWHRVSPALSDFLDIEDYRSFYRKSLEIPSRQQSFKTLYLNMPGEESDRWMSMERWDACRVVDPKKPEQYAEFVTELEGKECWAALDLAPVDDLSALTLVFPIGDKLRLLPFAWCGGDDIEERAQTEKVPYKIWRDRGFIRATSGNTTDFSAVRMDIEELAQRYRIKKLVADRQYAYDMGQALMTKGIKVEWFIQGFISYGPPVARLQKLVKEKAIEHPANPLLDYCMRNLRCDIDAAGNQKPSNKQRPKHEKIDAAVSSLMAVGAWMADQVEPKGSVYDKGGIFVA